jgi:hypothetical protein
MREVNGIEGVGRVSWFPALAGLKNGRRWKTIVVWSEFSWQFWGAFHD